MCVEILISYFCVHTFTCRSIQELCMFLVNLSQVTHLRKIWGANSLSTSSSFLLCLSDKWAFDSSSGVQRTWYAMKHFSVCKEELVSLHKRIKISFENQVFFSVCLTLYIIPAWVKVNFYKRNICRLCSWPDGVIGVYR